MINTVRLKKLVAMATAIILMAGFSPLNLAAAMMDDITQGAYELQDEPTYPETSYYYEEEYDLEKPTIPVYPESPIVPDEPEIQEEPETSEEPDIPEYPESQYEPCDLDYWYEYECDEYCEGCIMCCEYYKMDIMALNMPFAPFFDPLPAPSTVSWVGNFSLIWDPVPDSAGYLLRIQRDGVVLYRYSIGFVLVGLSLARFINESGFYSVEVAAMPPGLTWSQAWEQQDLLNWTLSASEQYDRPPSSLGVATGLQWGDVTSYGRTLHWNHVSGMTPACYYVIYLYCSLCGDVNEWGFPVANENETVIGHYWFCSFGSYYFTVRAISGFLFSVANGDASLPSPMITIGRSVPSFTGVALNIPRRTPRPLPPLTPPDILIYVLPDNDISDILLSAQYYDYVVIDLGDTGASGVDLPGYLFEGLDYNNAGIIIILPDGTLTLYAELVQSIADLADIYSRIELILYKYQEYEIIDEVLEILCYGDGLFNVQLLIDGIAVRYIQGRLAITVEYAESPDPGVWRIGRYGDLYPQEFIFDADEGLVTFFPDVLSNFIVGYSADARTIAIFRADGNNTTLYSRGSETMNLREGQRLSSGDRLTTGQDSTIFVTMDNSSILKLDENSRAEIGEAGRNLEILVTSGNVLVRVDAQQSHHVTTVRAQNITTGVRGTIFTVSVDAYGNETIIMLSGYAEVNGIPLMAGYMYVLAYGADYAAYEFVIMPITVVAIDDFTLAAIVGNFDYLAEYLDIDLAGVEIDAYPLPTPNEIANLLLESFEIDVDAFCDGDCVLQEEIYMMNGRRRIGARC